MRYNEDMKEADMPKRSPSQHVPTDMQARFDEITKLTDAFCQTYLNDEYRQLCRELTATLCRKRPSPLVPVKATTCACRIVHALVTRNLLFDPSQSPHTSPSQSWEAFHLMSSTIR